MFPYPTAGIGGAIVADPVSQSVAPGQNASFTVVAGGSNPLTYQWYFNTNAPIAGATNSALALTSVATTNAGTYSVVVSNLVGTATSAYATLAVNNPANAFEQWQLLYFGCTNCSQALAANDFDGDGLSNEQEFQAGTVPTNSVSALRVISVEKQSTNAVITWTTAGGRTNVVQTSSGGATGGYTTNYVDLSGLIVIPGSGDATTNYVHTGGITNNPSGYYRVRLVP